VSQRTGVEHATEERATFGSRYGSLMTLIGVAVGLGNVWRFPFMVGKFGGAAFVLFYVLVVVVIGVPGLMAELALGRHTRRGPVGAFAAGGFPFGRVVGWFFVFVVTAATGYYTAVIGWVLYYGLAEIARPFGLSVNAGAILPPESGFAWTSFALQMLCTGAVLVAYALVMVKGLRAGIERASLVIMPALCVILAILAIRAVTLPGAGEGVRWYILKLRFEDINAGVAFAAMGQAIFSLSLGGTFIVVYGSYLDASEDLARSAIWTAVGDTGSGLLAGFAIIPAVFALGLAPSSGPGLIFVTLPKVFATIPLGWLFGLLFFAGLFGAGYLSGVAALETLVAGITDNTRLTRTAAVWIMAAVVFVLAIPPSINNGIFIPWDLTFGSGMQTLGSLFAVITLGWCLSRSAALAELSNRGELSIPRWLLGWIRFGIPAAILAVGVWWLLTNVLGTVAGV
jgi:NSS family neurotransmitter:Na+ symporter